MFPVPSDEARDQVLWEGRGGFLLEETHMKALGGAGQVNVEATFMLYGKHLPGRAFKISQNCMWGHCTLLLLCY